MAIDIDGYGVLKVIASKPELFADIKSDVTKSARALMAKQLKAKSTSIDKLRRIFDALKAEQFSNVLDGLKETEIGALAKKVDKNNDNVAGASMSKNRELLIGLADGTIAPAQKAAPAVKTKPAKPPAKKKTVRAISSEAMAARWDGSNPDDPKRT